MPRYALSWTACQSSRPSAPRAKLPLPPSWPVSVAAAAKPERNGPLKPAGFPPTYPPPPVPWNLPFQPFVGRATNTFTRHPVGGCVTVARTRQDPSASLSSTESMVVFGSETLARSSCGITGSLSAKAGLGGASPTWARATAAGSATRTVEYPDVDAARGPTSKEGPRKAFELQFDGIILAEPFMKHSTADDRGANGCAPRGEPGDVPTPETGDGQVVKLHRGVGHDKTEGRALLAGTIAHSARDGVCPECRGIRASRRVDVGFRRGVVAGPRKVVLPGTTFIIRDRHREDARHLPGVQRPAAGRSPAWHVLRPRSKRRTDSPVPPRDRRHLHHGPSLATCES